MAVVLNNKHIQGAKGIVPAMQGPRIPNIELNTAGLGPLSPKSKDNLALAFNKSSSGGQKQQIPIGGSDKRP